MDRDRAYLEENLGAISEEIAYAVNREVAEGTSDVSSIYIQDKVDWDAEVIEVIEEDDNEED